MFLFDLVVEARHLEAKDADGMKLQKINSSTKLIFFLLLRSYLHYWKGTKFTVDINKCIKNIKCYNSNFLNIPNWRHF